MIPITIRKPVWHNRSISIRKDLVISALSQIEALQIKIEAKPYNDYIYTIDPAKVLAIGKVWFVKGTELINFPISEMNVAQPDDAKPSGLKDLAG